MFFHGTMRRHATHEIVQVNFQPRRLLPGPGPSLATSGQVAPAGVPAATPRLGHRWATHCVGGLNLGAAAARMGDPCREPAGQSAGAPSWGALQIGPGRICTRQISAPGPDSIASAGRMSLRRDNVSFLAVGV